MGRGGRVYACLGAWWDKPDLPPGVGKSHMARSLDGVDAYITGLVLEKIEAQAAARMLTDQGEDIVALRASLAELEHRREERFKEMEEGYINGKDWARFTAVLDPQIEDARAAVARALGPPAPLARFKGLDREGIGQVWEQATVEERRGYIAQVLDYIELRPAGGRGRTKGSGVGLRRGQGSYFRDPMGTVIPRWRAVEHSSAGAADGGGDIPAAGGHGGHQG